MTQFPRATAVLALAVAMSLGLSASHPPHPAQAAQPAGDDPPAPAGAVMIDGPPTEKEQVSYMIGRDVARSLEEVKDELDTKVLLDALESGLAGKDSLMTEEQVNQVREAFAQRIQAERIAEMMAAAKKNKEAGDAFLAANKDKDGVETTESGLQYQVITQGDGPRPTADDMVRVHYKGTLLDGETFDSSYERNEPAVFALRQVVPGWQEGIALMPVGSKYRFWIPSELGYGEQGTPGGPIGPNQVLVFEVELQDIVKQPTE